jgi:5-methylcytosine-specific restriction endonuclease McrA
MQIRLKTLMAGPEGVFPTTRPRDLRRPAYSGLRVADLVRGAWALYVRRFNVQIMGNIADLHEFLFGSERASLAVVNSILNEFQRGECFYCHRMLWDETAHVDHFIRWSRYPVDLGHNFVLAHASCNSNKSDRLGYVEHLNAWVAKSERVAEDMAREPDLCLTGRTGLPALKHRHNRLR